MKRDAPRPPNAGSTQMRLLTLQQVMDRTALSRSTIYSRMDQSLFPRPVRVGSRAIRWVEQEVFDYIASRPRTRPRRPLV